MTRSCLVFCLSLCLAALFGGGVAPAEQTSSAARITPKDTPAHPTINISDSDTGRTAHITLGQSAVPLYGPWKFTVGDSPLDPKTGKPLWAEPSFDDSRWETVDLRPKSATLIPNYGSSSYVDGWTAKGHPGYFGYAWYRILVQVQAGQGEALALAGPADVDDAYQLFVNGELTGNFGDFSGSRPLNYLTQPKMFPLSPTGSAKSTRVLAFRIWMEPYTATYQPGAGGMHTAPVLGEAHAVAADYQMRFLELIRAYGSFAVELLLFGQLAVVAFSLLLFDRSDRAYLWMGAFFLLTAFNCAIVVVGVWTEHESFPVMNLLSGILARPLSSAAWVMVWRIWFGQQRRAWIPWLIAGMTVLSMVANTVGDEVFFGLVSHATALHFVTLSLVIKLTFFTLQLWIVIEGIRRQGVEGWLVLIPVALNAIDAFSYIFRFLHLQSAWLVFGFNVNLTQIATLLMALVIALLLLRRLRQSVKRQRLMALDVKQAQEVQQVIVPEARLVLPGLTIESEFRPAREVGGDFFQVIPHKTNGSLLIVAGDVTGKGLQAGMLVALLVGAIRTVTDYDTEPEAVLRTLNKRLIGRGDAQATCLALRIEADGAAVLANAGHMAPYLNGEPLPMEGALPLGMFEGAEPSVMYFRLEDEDQLMLMSDGIAEAMDVNGNLFGFERVNDLMRTATTATEVARAAQDFGQEDDISVISVTRTAVLEPVTA
jgi:hypothetical protein